MSEIFDNAVDIVDPTLSVPPLKEKPKDKITDFNPETDEITMVDEEGKETKVKFKTDALRKWEGKTTFDFEKELVHYLQETPFFAELSRWFEKFPTKDLPTAAVGYSPGSDNFVFYYNPDFFAKLNKNQVRAVITHELYHIVFGHLGARKQTPHLRWNIATDAAINSIITQAHSLEMPEGCVIPGVRPKICENVKPEDMAAMLKVAAMIEKWPHYQTSEWYFKQLTELGKDGDSALEMVYGGQGIDIHDYWDDIPEHVRDMIKERLKNITRRATNRADQTSSGWGRIPADIREKIRVYVNDSIDWRRVLEQFVGYLNTATRTASMKRISKKYPYMHPGTKKKHHANLLVAVDQSGSVGDDEISMFFGALTKLSKLISVTVVPFDTEVLEKHLFMWRKGAKPQLERVKCGGTDFNAPTNYINKNRGKYDGLLILTDGQAAKPVPCNKRRAYILAPGCKMEFVTTDTVMIMTKDGSKASTVDGSYH